MSGPPVIIASNGRGFPVRPVDENAPVLTVSANSLGTPIVISERGAPFIIEGLAPSALSFQEIILTNGSQGQWVGFSDGGNTRPQPAFGSISGQPTTSTQLLALYDDTNSGVVLAVFAGDWVYNLDGLQISIGGFVLQSFEVELISGNTWVRFSDMPGDWAAGEDYEILFGYDLLTQFALSADDGSNLSDDNDNPLETY